MRGCSRSAPLSPSSPSSSLGRRFRFRCPIDHPNNTNTRRPTQNLSVIVCFANLRYARPKQVPRLPATDLSRVALAVRIDRSPLNYYFRKATFWQRQRFIKLWTFSRCQKAATLYSKCGCIRSIWTIGPRPKMESG